MLPCVRSVIDHRRRQNVIRTLLTHTPNGSLFFLPHFDVICDFLGCVPLGLSGSGSVIQDGAPKETNSGHGFIGSFDALRSEWSWITDPDQDHPKGTHPYRTDTRQHVIYWLNSYRVQSKTVLKSSNMNEGDCNESLPALPVRPILCVCVWISRATS